jgi:hypothetical protein
MRKTTKNASKEKKSTLTARKPAKEAQAPATITLQIPNISNSVLQKFRKWITGEQLPVICKKGQNLSVQTLSGKYIQVIGADDSLYISALLKAFVSLLQWECNGFMFSEDRITKKIAAAYTLFGAERDKLSNCVINQNI